MGRYDKDTNNKKIPLYRKLLALMFLVLAIYFFSTAIYNFITPDEPNTSEILENAPEVCNLPNAEWTWEIHDECYWYFDEHGLRIIQMPDGLRELVTTEMWHLLHEDCVHNQNGEWENWSYMGFHGYCSNPQDLKKIIPEFVENYEEHKEAFDEIDREMGININQ